MNPFLKPFVDRFLGWKLPKDFAPDCGISFKPDFNEGTPWPMKHEPTGTSLLTAIQAEAMLEHILGGQAGLDVLAERQRQIDPEGWTPEHDDQHTTGELAEAGACYAHTAAMWAYVAQQEALPEEARDIDLEEIPPTNKWSAPDGDDESMDLRWPWDMKWWKPCPGRRMLVKAGALILAEIERMDRIAAAKNPQA